MLTTFEKMGMGIIAIAMVTTLILPKRQTGAVITSLFGGLSSWTRTAMGGGES